MLTVTTDPLTNTDTQINNEVTLSDAEISRRVLHIRSGWSLSERVARRREAERRFVELLDTLMCAEAA